MMIFRMVYMSLFFNIFSLLRIDVGVVFFMLGMYFIINIKVINVSIVVFVK